MGSANSADEGQRAQLLLFSQQLRDPRNIDQWAPIGGTLVEGLEPVVPVEQPGLRQTQVFKNPLQVKGRSVRLRSNFVTGGNQVWWELSFTFDAAIPCEVLVYVGAPEENTEWPPPKVDWKSAPQSYRDACLGLEYSAEVDIGKYTHWQASYDSDGVPSQSFCIELRATEGIGAQAAEWTVGRFVHCNPDDANGTAAWGERPSMSVEIVKKLVRLSGPGPPVSYEVHEVFGAESHGPAVLGQDCVICMSEMRDTAVLPCRHMCLCGVCAETMRSRVQYRSYRCPICRERVSSLLQISKSLEEVNATVVPEEKQPGVQWGP